MKFSFVHAADLHLDTPFEGIARVSPAIAARLRDASLEAFDGLVELAIARRAAFALIAGDVYDGASRGVRAQLRFLKGLERLAGHGIQTFVVHGNHDPLEGWSAIRSWPEGVTVFGGDGVAAVPVERDGRRLATVYGISYGRREETENLIPRFKRGAGRGLHVGLVHCSVGVESEHAPYCPCTLRDLQAAGMDYWALGHIHRRCTVNRAAPWIVYPGNLQGRSPKPSECGAKGAIVVEADEGGIKDVSFAALDRVRFVALELDIADIGDLADLRRVLAVTVDKFTREHAGRGLLVRVVLTGRGDLHRDLARQGVIEGVLAELRADAEDADPFLWWESIICRTRATLELEAIRLRGDFSAELLRVWDALGADDERLARFREQATADLLHAKLAGAVPEAAPDEMRREFEEARALALELLEEEAEA